MRGEKLGANLPLFWNNDGKDRSKGQICPLAKKEVFTTIAVITIDPLGSVHWQKKNDVTHQNQGLITSFSS